MKRFFWGKAKAESVEEVDNIIKKSEAEIFNEELSKAPNFTDHQNDVTTLVNKWILNKDSKQAVIR